MGTYKFTDEVEADLIRIHQWGVRNYREEQADRYFTTSFVDDKFIIELRAERPDHVCISGEKSLKGRPLYFPLIVTISHLLLQTGFLSLWDQVCITNRLLILVIFADSASVPPDLHTICKI